MAFCLTEDRDMTIRHKRNKSRWALAVLLALTLVFNGTMLANVYAEEYAAAIGTVNYQTLDQAVAAVAEGQTIRLLGPVSIAPEGESGIIDKPGVSFFLDLGNQVISGNQQKALLQVVAGNLTVYNGQIVNETGPALSAGAASVSKVAYPVGYQAPSPIESQLDVPAAYHINLGATTNGTIHYGAADGPLASMSPDNLYAGEATSHAFYFVPAVGYKVGGLTVNGVSQTAASQYTVSSLTQDLTIGVTFKKITFSITPKAYANGKVAKLGVTLTPSSATVEYGGSQTFTYTVRQGFRLIDVQVNNVSLGPVTTIQLKNVTTPQTVKIMLEKTALFIMLDAGHYINYNHSPVLDSYYEGNTMWTYHKYLEQSLEQYPNIIVDTTRPDNSKAIGSALGPWERGAMSEGYDLMLSVHSNAASTASADHPVAICTLDSRYATVSRELGTKLANKVAEIMKTNEAAKVYTKAQSDGQDWYGINRGATSVGVPSIILEHSFHTNYRATVWLSQDANLRTMAAAEAKVIADYYGIAPAPASPAVPEVTPPAAPLNFAVAHRTYNSLKLTWSASQNATAYVVYRSASATTGFVRYAKTTSTSYVDTGLTTGKAYYYKVRAYRTVDGKNYYSGATAVIGRKPYPNAPAISVSAGIDKATISWAAVPGASGYRIYRISGKTGTYAKVKTITNASTLKWTNYGLPTGKVYTYKVRAYRVVDGTAVFGFVSAPKSVTIK
jgi:N-acetylmuramoyl-L-alanine amidase